MSAPPFTYFGAKQRIAPRIAAMLPDHAHYVEPFAGSLSVLLAKRPAPHETVNDADNLLMTFWRVLREQHADLVRACALTPHSRAELAVAARHPTGPNDLETARRTWVRLSQARGASLEDTPGWRRYVDPGKTHSSMPSYLDGYVTRMAGIVGRLHRVSLECGDWRPIVADYGRAPKCLLYVDPPYYREARSDQRRRYRMEMFSATEHTELAEALTSCDAAVVVSGYPSPLYDRLYAGWHHAELRATKGNGPRRGATEVLWSNRPLNASEPLWTTEAIGRIAT